MIIRCTECETKYVVAPQAIGKDGRLVKCSKCAHSWFEEPPEEGLEIVPEQVLSQDQGSDSKTEEDMKSKSEKKDPVMPGKDQDGADIKRNVPAVIEEKSRGIMVGWITLVVLLVGLGISFTYFRSSLEDSSSFTQALYAKWDYVVMGVKPKDGPVPPAVIETRAHPASFLSMRQSAEVRFIEGVPSLALALEISNASDSDFELPIMTGVIFDADGVEVFSWVMKLDPSQVPAGGMQQYNIDVDNIPLTSTSAEVSFDF